MAVTTEQTNFLVSLYVGYFDRAPDPAGLQFWIDQVKNGRELNTIAADFAASPAAKALYPFLVSQDMSEAADFIASVYQNLFNTAPDAAGLAFWKGVLEDGSVAPTDMIEAVIKGATGAGKQTLDNKVAVATDFVINAANKPGFEFDKAAGDAAKDAIDGVTDDAATVAAGEAKTDAFFDEKDTGDGGTGDGGSGGGGSSGGGSTGSPPIVRNFTLTVGADTVTGTTGDDTIDGTFDSSGGTPTPTYTAADTIDGGAGADTLTISTPTTDLTVDLSGISNVEVAKLSVGDNSKAIAATTDGNFETVEITGGAAVTVNDKALAADQKLKTVKSDGNTGALTIGATNATDIQQLWLSNTDQSATVTANAGSRDLTVALDNVTGGTITDAQATGLTLKTSGQASGGVTVSAAAATAVTLDAGADLDLASLAVDAAENIAIKGGSKVTINAATVGTLDVIDASDNRGGVTFIPVLANDIQFIGSAGADTISIGATTKEHDLGAGDDTVAMSADFGAGGKIDAGAGKDTLAMTADLADSVTKLGTFKDQISNFEALSLSGGSGVIDLENLDDLAEVTIDGALSGATTLNGMASGGTLNFDGAPTQNVIVGVKDAATGTADALNVGISGAASVDAKQLTTSGVETYNIVTDDTNDSGTLKHVISLTDNNIDTITIAGDAGLQVNYTGSELTNFDASGVTAGDVKWQASRLNNAVTVKGGAGDDELNLNNAIAAITVDGGDGNDTIYTSDGSDTINGGAGDDVIVGGIGGDSLTGGDGQDTFEFWHRLHSTSNDPDTITDFERGTDKIDLSNVINNGDYRGVVFSTDALETIFAQYPGFTAVFLVPTNELYINVDQGGIHDENDMIIKLPGVEGLSSSDLVF